MKAVRSQVFALTLLVTGLRAPAGAQVPFLRGDINLDGRVRNFLFVGGLPPQQPWPHCGADASEDGIGCEGYPEC